MIWLSFVMSLFVIVFPPAPLGAASPQARQIIDSFRTYGRSDLGTKWTFYADSVMGGKSTGYDKLVKFKGKYGLRLRGTVSLKNRGGFLQTALYLHPQKRAVDASRFQGVRVQIYGNNQTYHVQLRTSQTWFPWQFFTASFQAPPRWTVVKIPFKRFSPENMNTRTRLNTRRLKRIAIAAYKRKMKADIVIAQVEFY